VFFGLANYDIMIKVYDIQTRGAWIYVISMKKKNHENTGDSFSQDIHLKGQMAKWIIG